MCSGPMMARPAVQVVQPAEIRQFGIADPLVDRRGFLFTPGLAVIR